MELAEQIRRANLDVHRDEAPLYDRIHPELLGRPEQRHIAADLDLIASLLPATSLVRALDMGCGTGNLTLKYLARGYHVTAVDLSVEMIGMLRRKLASAQAPPVDLVVTDAESFVCTPHTAATWDLVSFSSVLHHLPDYQTVLLQTLQQLRPGGTLYVTHEPLPPAPARRPLLATITARLDLAYILARKGCIYLDQFVRSGWRPRRIDYSWSDYHAREGIDGAAIARAVEAAGAETRLYRTARLRFSPWLATLDARFEIGPATTFSLIAQRPPLATTATPPAV